RAGGGARHTRERGAGAPPEGGGRLRPGDAARRSRHGARALDLRPRGRARVREGDRPGHARGRSARSAGGAGVPRERGCRGPGGDRLAVSDAVLTLEGLTAGYDQAAVVRDLDLTVGSGEVVALLGANGAGKTTTLRVISG